MSSDDTSLKDVFEHLRFVHFSLVATATALIITSLSNDAGELDRAAADIDGIITASKGLYQTWLQDLVERTTRNPVPPSMPTFPKDVGVIVDGTKRFVAAIRVPAPFLPTLAGPRGFKNYSYDYLKPEQRVLRMTFNSLGPQLDERLHLKTPETVGEFRDLWDDLNDRSVHSPQELTKAALIEIIEDRRNAGDDATPDIRIVPTLDKAAEVPSGLEMSWPPAQGLWVVLDDEDWERLLQSKVTHAGLGPDHNDDHRATHALRARVNQGDERIDILIPVFTSGVRISGQEHIRDLAKADWTPGSFEGTFPELARYTAGLDSLRFEEVRLLLRNEKSRTGGPIETLGLRIPTVVITQWGLAALLAICLYLLLHVRNLPRVVKRTRAAPPFAWIGVYPDLVSQVVLALSAVAAPTIAGVLLTLLLRDGPTQQLVVAAAAALVVFLLSAWSYWKLRRWVRTYYTPQGVMRVRHRGQSFR